MDIFPFFQGLGWLPVLNFILVIIAFFTSYLVSSYRDFIATPWPFISDTGTLAPASCWFGLLLSLAAYSMGLTFLVRFLQIREHLGHHDKVIKVLNILGLIAGLIGMVGILMVATFQETQALRGHLIGALTGFSCASIYAFIQSILSILLIKRTFFNHKVIAVVRFVLTAICLVGLLVTHTCVRKSGYSLPPYTDDRDPPYTNKNYYYAATVAEWTLAFSFFVFVPTFIREFSTIRMSIAISTSHSACVLNDNPPDESVQVLAP